MKVEIDANLYIQQNQYSLTEHARVWCGCAPEGCQYSQKVRF